MVADIDKILLNMATEEAATEEVAAATEEITASEPEREKEITEDPSEDEAFNFQNLVGQELTKAEKEELKEYIYLADIGLEHFSSVALMTKGWAACGIKLVRRLSVLYQRVLVSRSSKQISAATDDSTSSVVYFIPISR
jgi:hypothetical protein